MKYVVRVAEMLCKCIIIEAESAEDAERKAEYAHTAGLIELDYDDYYYANFDCMSIASDEQMSLCEEVEVY